ncbi:MAG TPA: SRPBCC family protein [Longimicrobiales bacterium]|nr:SRPBCC family protein [Longimicrobiales bacterium]
MTTIDERVMRAPPTVCFRVAADVERWPEILPHYRWVRLHEPTNSGSARVEMAAWRDFAGPLRYPTWWLSEMRVAESEPAIYFRHVGGITTGMDVKWAFLPAGSDTLVRITHAWRGPPWPLIGGFAWRHVIGPRFVSFIAARTLLGVGREAERRHLQRPV